MKNKPKKKSLQVWIDKWIPIIVLIALTLPISWWNHTEHNKLLSDNNIAVGYIYKLGFRCTKDYYFFVDGRKFFGCTIDSELHVGDTIQVRYYPLDPRNNKEESSYQRLK